MRMETSAGEERSAGETPAQSGSGRRQVLFVEEVLQLLQKMMAAGLISLQSPEVVSQCGCRSVCGEVADL